MITQHTGLINAQKRNCEDICYLKIGIKSITVVLKATRPDGIAPTTEEELLKYI